ncbi:MAG: nucleotidyltransferase family protein, partial [Bacilli bacterium]|nr:nucleotidyltransferase family protein [Bacilli bacterium]
FELLKYKILSENDLSKYLDVNEGLDKRIKSSIMKAHNLDELIKLIKTKRYTYNKINRVLLHILTGTTKEDYDKLNKISYIRVLGFSNQGQKYLKVIKKNSSIPIITNYHELNDYILDYELKITNIYNFLIDKEELNLVELKSIPKKSNK